MLLHVPVFHLQENYLTSRFLDTSNYHYKLYNSVFSSCLYMMYNVIHNYNDHANKAKLYIMFRTDQNKQNEHKSDVVSINFW